MSLFEWSDQMDEDFDILDIEMINMNFAMTRLSLASIHAAEGKVDAAIDEYSKVLEVDPELYLVYFNRGKLYWRKGERRKAMEDFSRAIRLEPSVAMTYICRGDILSEQGDYMAAKQDYCKALELSPANDSIIQRIDRIRDL
jgi:tetratricopeptide (TPR) repeat protein